MQGKCRARALSASHLQQPIKLEPQSWHTKREKETLTIDDGDWSKARDTPRITRRAVRSIVATAVMRLVQRPDSQHLYIRAFDA